MKYNILKARNHRLEDAEFDVKVVRDREGNPVWFCDETLPVFEEQEEEVTH